MFPVIFTMRVYMNYITRNVNMYINVVAVWTCRYLTNHRASRGRAKAASALSLKYILASGKNLEPVLWRHFDGAQA